jgi:hypothetical protein
VLHGRTGGDGEGIEECFGQASSGSPSAGLVPTVDDQRHRGSGPSNRPRVT